MLSDHCSSSQLGGLYLTYSGKGLLGEPCLSPGHIVKTTAAAKDTPGNMHLIYKSEKVYITTSGDIVTEEPTPQKGSAPQGQSAESLAVSASVWSPSRLAGLRSPGNLRLTPQKLKTQSARRSAKPAMTSKEGNEMEAADEDEADEDELEVEVDQDKNAKNAEASANEEEDEEEEAPVMKSAGVKGGKGCKGGKGGKGGKKDKVAPVGKGKGKAKVKGAAANNAKAGAKAAKAVTAVAKAKAKAEAADPKKACDKANKGNDGKGAAAGAAVGQSSLKAAF